jgi:hypothetical protein
MREAASSPSIRFPARYQRPRLVANGGMGSVYCADDTVLQRVVAIKVLDLRFTSDPSIRKRFTREALAAARLSSDPHTVTTFDVGECDGRPFIVMEFLSGGSLEDLLKREGAQPTSRALTWLEEAAQALDHAHAHNVVHRDVKPANLLLTGDSHIRVADFGVAIVAGLDSFTQTGTVIGTAGYLSPEQAQGNPATGASDRYSLGVVAFELLTGSRPFESTTPAAEAAAHMHVPPPPPSSISPQIPREVDEVFAHALAKDPGQRFSTGAEFVAALRAAFATAAGPTNIIAPTAPSKDATDYAMRAGASPGRPRRRAVLALALLLLVAGGVIASFALAQRDGSPGTNKVLRVTVTERGATVIRTVTRAATPPPPAATTPTPAAVTTAPATASSSSSLGLQGYRRMQAGDYAGAIPLLEQAASDLEGSGSLSEAYNDYNLAFSLTRTGGCSTRVLQLLDASQAIQGARREIEDLRKACE